MQNPKERFTKKKISEFCCEKLAHSPSVYSIALNSVLSVHNTHTHTNTCDAPRSVGSCGRQTLQQPDMDTHGIAWRKKYGPLTATRWLWRPRPAYGKSSELAPCRTWAICRNSHTERNCSIWRELQSGRIVTLGWQKSCQLLDQSFRRVLFGGWYSGLGWLWTVSYQGEKVE